MQWKKGETGCELIKQYFANLYSITANQYQIFYMLENTINFTLGKKDLNRQEYSTKLWTLCTEHARIKIMRSYIIIPVRKRVDISKIYMERIRK